MCALCQMFWVVPWMSEQRGESRLKAPGFCVTALWKQKTIWHPSSGVGESGILLYLLQLIFINSLRAVTWEASVALGSATCKACERLLKRFQNARSLVPWRHDARMAFVAAKSRVWINPVALYIHILKMLV